MRNYITLRSVLGHLPGPVKTEGRTIDFLLWFLEALRTLPDVTTTVSKMMIVEIVNGKVELDKSIKLLNEVRYLSCAPTESCFESLSACVTATTPQDLTPQVCEPTINFKMFLDSPYYKRNYSLMRYVGEDRSLLCKNCPNNMCDSTYTFTVTPEKILYTTLQDGWLCINYDTEVCDDNGDLLIPDVIEIIQYLVSYALMKHFEQRMFLKEEQTFNFFQTYRQQAEIFFKKARSKVMLSGLNPNGIQDLYRPYYNLIQIPANYVFSR